MDDAFWSDELKILFRILLPFMAEGAQGGVEGGMAFLSTDLLVELGLDFSLINQHALDWARIYTYDLVKDIIDTSRDFLRTAVGEWIQSGAPLDDLIVAIDSSGLFGPVRSEMIAVTEVTRAYAEGNLIVWKDGGVEGKRWMTAEDEIVCEICRPLGELEPISITAQGYVVYGNESAGSPPAHVRCRCYLHPVVQMEK